jgi:hypothetical protein
VFNVGINTREKMNVFSFLEWLCRSSCIMFLGILNWVWNVFCLEKSTYCFVGVPHVFGIERMLRNNDVWIELFYPYFLFNF